MVGMEGSGGKVTLGMLGMVGMVGMDGIGGNVGLGKVGMVG